MQLTQSSQQLFKKRVQILILLQNMAMTILSLVFAKHLLKGEFANDNIMMFYAKHMIASSCYSQDISLVSSAIIVICDRENSSFTILDKENQNIMLMSINCYGSHQQLIIVLNALRNDKDTSVLFLDSLVRLYYPSFKMHVSHETGLETNELEIDF